MFNIKKYKFRHVFEKDFIRDIAIFLIVFLFLGVFLNASEKGKEWFLELSDHLDYQKRSDAEIKRSIVEYHKILLKCGLSEQAFKILRFENFEIEKEFFIRYLLNNHFLEHSPSVGQLKIVYRELSRLPKDVDLFNEYLKLFSFAHKLRESDLAEKILLIARKYLSKEIGRKSYARKAAKLASLYSLYKKLGKHDAAEKVKKEMAALAELIRPQVNKKEDSRTELVEYSICNSYINAHIQLKEFDAARYCLKRVESILDNLSDRNIMVRKYNLITLYYEIGAIEDSRRILEALVDQMIVSYLRKARCSNGSESLFDLLDYFFSLPLDTTFYLVVEPDFFLEKYNVIQTFSNFELESIATRLLINIYIHQKNFKLAIEVAKSFKEKWPEAKNDTDENYFAIAVAQQKYDPNFNYKKYKYKFKDRYYNLCLDYYFSKDLVERNSQDEGRFYIERALKILNNYTNPQTFIRLNEISYDSIGELYWKLGDDEGLTRTLNWVIRRKDELDCNIAGIVQYLKRWLLDVYLRKGKFEPAWRIIESTDDFDLKCLGLLYSAKYFLDKGQIKKAETMFERVLKIFKNRKINDFTLIYGEFYRVLLKSDTTCLLTEKEAEISAKENIRWGNL